MIDLQSSYPGIQKLNLIKFSRAYVKSNLNCTVKSRLLISSFSKLFIMSEIDPHLKISVLMQGYENYLVLPERHPKMQSQTCIRAGNRQPWFPYDGLEETVLNHTSLHLCVIAWPILCFTTIFD